MTFWTNKGRFIGRASHQKTLGNLGDVILESAENPKKATSSERQVPNSRVGDLWVRRCAGNVKTC